MDAAIIEEQLASAFDGILMNIDQTQINVEKYIKHKSRIDEEKAQNINKELSQALGMFCLLSFLFLCRLSRGT